MEVQVSFGLPWQMWELGAEEATLQAPPTPPCLCRQRFMPPAELICACRDIREIHREKVVAYARTLQHWAEQNNLPARGEQQLLAESVLELREEVKWYLSITNGRGLPGGGPSWVIFLCNIWDIWHGCWWICRWTMAVLLHMHSGFPHLNIRADDCDIINMMSWGSLVLQGEETIKGEHDQASGLLLLSSGCFDTSIWVFSKPQTLYFGCLSDSQVGSISRMYSVVCFSISMHWDLFGGLWVIVTSFIWW